jgi:DNA mismatch repair ATPase MutS
MQEEIKHHYQSRLAHTRQSIATVKKNIYYLGTIRLLIVLCTISISYVIRTQGAVVIISVISAGILLFLCALLKYNRLQKRKNYLEISASCDEDEIKSLDYDFSAFDGAPERVNASHPFGLDLDIFGHHSLFQSINRTCTAGGKRALAAWFENPLHEPAPIKARQDVVAELSKKPDFMHHFRATGLLSPGSDSDMEAIDAFIRQPAYIRNKKGWRFLRFVFLFLWVAIISLLITGVISDTMGIVIYAVLLLISESQAKKISRLQQHIGKRVSVITSYSHLIEAVEAEQVESELLKELKARFGNGKKPASVVIGRLARIAGELDQRFNMVVQLILNPLLLWDIHKAIEIEQWKETHGAQLATWIGTLGEYDAFCSLGAFSFNHPEYIFPEFTNHYFEMEGKQLGHPLMNRKTCVRNDIHIDKQPYFLIVTGANMAGKSTYLRTIGVNFVLACIGAPVWADSLSLCPASIVTSLRTSDSLNDNESYFFAELKRLKMIIDRLHAGEKLFIVLDEILKGTNSVDKQKGSLALIQQFVRLQSCGIIATHDLLLGGMETTFPDNIRNYRFEADIDGDELVFSYRLREGVARNMNATFLMNKMGITV